MSKEQRKHSNKFGNMKGNKGLLDKNRFKYLNELREKELKSLTIPEAIKKMEDLLSCGIIEEFIDNFYPDTPLCLKLCLKKRKDEISRGR